jgi:SAM-dependent methyltransferase
MVGNAELLSNNFTFHKLIEFARSRHSFFRIPLQDYVTGRFSVAPYDPVERDLSQASYQLSDGFADAFRTLVTQPVESASAEGYPDMVMGNDMSTNLNAIGYGRANITAPLRMYDGSLLPEEAQTLLYCHYLMRQRYCASRMVFADMAESLRSSLRLTGGRLRMVDIGCGPATSGIAFAELFLGDAPDMVYTGIDISTEMKRMGDAMLTRIFGERLRHDSAESLASLGRDYWEFAAEQPATVVINIAHLFPNVTSQFAERLARQIVELTEQYPHHRYMVVIQHGATAARLNASLLFGHVLAPHAAHVRHASSAVPFSHNGHSGTLPFGYTVMQF